MSFDRLGDLMGQVAADDLTEIGGRWRDLRPGSAAYRQARAAAVADAVRRARNYASAVGRCGP